MQAKICSSCGVFKSLDDFHKDRNRPDGRRSACKSCRSQKNARPERAALPPVEPPPFDEEELRQVARTKAIRDTIENHWPEFKKRYKRYLDIMGLQRKVWYELK